MNQAFLLKPLIDGRVEFVLIGGAAMMMRGSAYVTQDIGICYSRTPQDLERLASALRAFHPRLRGATADLPFRLDEETIARGLNFTLTTEDGDIDLLGEVMGLGDFPHVSAEADWMDLDVGRCLVLSISGLTKSKRASNRPKDIVALTELEALQQTDDETNGLGT